MTGVTSYASLGRKRLGVFKSTGKAVGDIGIVGMYGEVIRMWIGNAGEGDGVDGNRKGAVCGAACRMEKEERLERGGNWLVVRTRCARKKGELANWERGRGGMFLGSCCLGRGSSMPGQTLRDEIWVP